MKSKLLNLNKMIIDNTTQYAAMTDNELMTEVKTRKAIFSLYLHSRNSFGHIVGMEDITLYCADLYALLRVCEFRELVLSDNGLNSWLENKMR